MAKDKSARRGEEKSPTDLQPIKESVLFGPDEDAVDLTGLYDQQQAPLSVPEGVSKEKELGNYKDALASVADRYLSKSSKPQTQPVPDQPRSGSQTPDKSSEALPASPSPKPQAGRARRLAPGQWVTK